MANLVKISVSKETRDLINKIRDEMNGGPSVAFANGVTQADVVQSAMNAYMAGQDKPAIGTTDAVPPSAPAATRPADNMSKMLEIIRDSGKNPSLIMKTLKITAPVYFTLWQDALRLSYVHAEMGQPITVTPLGAEYMLDRS